MFSSKHRYLPLIVVIAIIAILAGMLLPSLSKVKNTATAISCLSNTKQSMARELMYADMFDSFLFVIDMKFPLEGGGTANYGFNDYFLKEGGWDVNAGICPSIPTPNWHKTYGYGIVCVRNVTGEINHYSASNYSFIYTKKLKRASSIPILGDSGKQGEPGSGHLCEQYYHGWVDNSSSMERFQFRHNNKVNFAYLDGHSESIDQNKAAADFAVLFNKELGKSYTSFYFNSEKMAPITVSF